MPSKQIKLPDGRRLDIDTAWAGTTADLCEHCGCLKEAAR